MWNTSFLDIFTMILYGCMFSRNSVAPVNADTMSHKLYILNVYSQQEQKVVHRLQNSHPGFKWPFLPYCRADLGLPRTDTFKRYRWIYDCLLLLIQWLIEEFISTDYRSDKHATQKPNTWPWNWECLLLSKVMSCTAIYIHDMDIGFIFIWYGNSEPETILKLTIWCITNTLLSRK